MKHKLDGNGKYIVSWLWEYQPNHGKFGWTYYLLYDNLEDAEEWVRGYVKQHFPNVNHQIANYIGPESWFIKITP